VSRNRFGWFRVLLGLYLFCYIRSIWPHAFFLYSIEGFPRFERFVHEPGINLLRYAKTQKDVTDFLSILNTLVMAFTVGVFRRTLAVFVFYGFACMFMMGEYATCVANAYVGWVILACILIPPGEGWSLDSIGRRKADAEWRFPAAVFAGAWAIYAVSYSASGLDKLLYNENWQDGSAMTWVIGTPLRRESWLRDAVEAALTGGLGKWLTWFVMAIELLALPMCFFRKARAVNWVLMTLTHVGVLVLARIPLVSTGMLVFHLFIFDERWLSKEFWLGLAQGEEGGGRLWSRSSLAN